MADDSLLRAGGILLLVGGILSAATAVFLLLLAVGLSTFVEAFGGTTGEAAAVGAIYGVIAVVLGIGSIFGFLGFKQAREGDANQAFVFGLIAALVPPVQVVPLIGAILCKVADRDA